MLGAFRRFEESFKRYWEKLADPVALFTALVAFFTFALVVVAALQWATLEKTDHTLRAGQRAFVFVKGPPNKWLPPKQNGTTIFRSFYLEWENSGNTPTKDLRIWLWCPCPQPINSDDPISANRTTDTKASQRVLGPRQSVWGGACEYPSDMLEEVRLGNSVLFVAARATYSDIFGETHITEYCVKMASIDGNLTKAESTIESHFASCEKHNCADAECKSP